MKKAAYLIIVNTDTPGGVAISKANIIQYHTNAVHAGGLGLNRPRIDDLILLEGELVSIIPESSPNEVDLWGISEGINGLSGMAKYVALVGGRTKDGSKEWDTRTKEQKETLKIYVQYQLLRNPDLIVMGLNQVPAMGEVEMPSFNVAKWLESIGVPEKNIF
ncbi:MAG TPA: N-acetylmuramoyl-L-alanine amidase [Vicingaceae bacterium]